MRTKLHFETAGSEDDPSVIFLHGFMGSAADWREIVDGLRSRFFCIAVDLPGHGRSVRLASDGAYSMKGAAELLEAVLDEIGLDRSHIVGYSMGGRLALYFAVHHADRCRRVVLESASPGLEAESDRRARRGVDEAHAVRLETQEYGRFLEEWYRQPLFVTLERHTGLLERMIASRITNSPNELAIALRGMSTGRQPSLWEDLDAVSAPVLAAAGALDGKYAEIAERMAIRMPKARSAIIPNAGHNVHAEYPGVYRDLIQDFLKHQPG